MHNMLAALFSIFFISSTTARVVPPTRRATPSSSLAYKCSFTLLHKQLHPFTSTYSSQPKQNYIQINTLVDHANGIIVDVAHSRPAEAFNSYSYVSSTHWFAITGLLDGTNLTVKGEDGSDWLGFQREETLWTADGEKDVADGAWCEVGEWDSVGDSTVNTRERKIDCAFFCEKVEIEEEEEEERDELR